MKKLNIYFEVKSYAERWKIIFDRKGVKYFMLCFVLVTQAENIEPFIFLGDIYKH